MSVLCLFIIQDIILDHVLRNYIASTPFLSLKKIESEELLCSNILSASDIIIIEPDFIENEFFHSIVQIINSKPTLIICDNKDVLKIYGFENAVLLSKALSYSDFVNGISKLIDNQQIKLVSNSYS